MLRSRLRSKWRGNAGGGLASLIGFKAPLNDAGAGIANILPTLGIVTTTYTRASTAWTKLISGLWASVAAGQPRFCYIGRDTTPQTEGGYFSERTATQLIAVTAAIRDMRDVAWLPVNTSAFKSATGIDGVANSASTVQLSSAPLGTLLQAFVGAAVARTFSAFVRRKAGTGTVRMQNGASFLDITALINTVTYTRIQLTSTDLNPMYGFEMAGLLDEIEVDFNQFEAGVEATSPIDTGGATRSPDMLTYSIGASWSVTLGSAYCEVYINNTTGVASGFAKSYMSTTSAQLVASPNAVNQESIAYLTDGGPNSATITGLTNSNNGFCKRASSWGSGIAIVSGSQSATAAFDGSVAAGPLGVGCFASSGGQMNGIIRNPTIYRPQLSVSTLQALTP